MILYSVIIGATLNIKGQSLSEKKDDALMIYILFRGLKMKKHKPPKKLKIAAKHTPKEYEVIHKSRKYNKLYTQKKWRDLRQKILDKNPFCTCGAKASVVDHIEPWEGNLHLFYLESNLQSKCKPCHDRKTAKEDNKRGKNGKFVSKYE